MHNDIHKIQWMIQTDKEFVVVMDLLENKYTKSSLYFEEELVELTKFFKYFRGQCGPGSHT